MTSQAHNEFGRRQRVEDPYDDWDDGRYDAPPRRGLFSRLFGLVKLAVFLTPLGIFLYGYFVADCRASGGTGFGQIVQAGVCARGQIVDSAVSLGDGLKLIRRVID
ncbi:hypothetical protein [Methylobacterium radiodurans]|uniref:Uncharacterized protein n=1 Tax=Methylobacterium radiodurans TaxID=2202828 RepID=A0A2U8VMI7_9HYPH|nr:hypothetical protein [Methylobacterium radiodurans]AWN34899.1 hypothetical protein DK427_03375 [Methylobacterium radiodurans]